MKLLVMKNITSEVENSLGDINRRLITTEENLGEHENIAKTIQIKGQKRQKIENHEQSHSDLWNNIKYSNICVTAVSQRREKEGRRKNI